MIGISGKTSKKIWGIVVTQSYILNAGIVDVYANANSNYKQTVFKNRNYSF